MIAMNDSIRLIKRVAELASCSRTEAEQYIEGGWVSVDGQVIEEPGYRVLAQQNVELAPGAKLQPVEPVTILLHKPAEAGAQDAHRLIAPANLFAQDRSGNRFLKRHAAGLIVTDPMEPGASGLLVLTQDWRIRRKLVDDAARIEHEYVVEVTGDMQPGGLPLLNHGLSFNGKPLPPIKVSWQSESRLRFALKAPPRGLIGHMCGQVGLTVMSLKRIRLGRIPLAGLPEGQWRYLLGYERF
jgi:23S rRNA pseudouridine2604 synthase